MKVGRTIFQRTPALPMAPEGGVSGSGCFVAAFAKARMKVGRTIFRMAPAFPTAAAGGCRRAAGGFGLFCGCFRGSSLRIERSTEGDTGKCLIETKTDRAEMVRSESSNRVGLICEERKQRAAHRKQTGSEEAEENDLVEEGVTEPDAEHGPRVRREYAALRGEVAGVAAEPLDLRRHASRRAGLRKRLEELLDLVDLAGLVVDPRGEPLVDVAAA